MSMKQGIVTILGSDCENNRAAASIRRTLSADMSSKKWMEQNGLFSPGKRIAPSEETARDHDSNSSFSSEGEECERIDNVWRMIQSQKEVPESDINWGTILTRKSGNSVSNLMPAPYVHPLVKRSASAMSEKSLEICTESLGSETGSDVFSTCLNSEAFVVRGEDKEDRTRVGRECTKEPNPFEDFHVVKYKTCPSRPIPPPLPSISGGNGVSLHIRSNRKDGRLVLEAVAVPPRKYFHSQRGDGRLVLSLINPPTSQQENEFEKVSGEFPKEENSKSLPNEMMKRLMVSGNKNTTWPHKLNKIAYLSDAVEVMAQKDDQNDLPISHSLPPLPRLTRLISASPVLPPPSAATSFNPYEYFWRSKTTAAGSFINPKIPSIPQAASFKNSKTEPAKAFDHQYQEMAPDMKSHRIEHFVPNFRGCNKEPRRSLPVRTGYCCIATS